MAEVTATWDQLYLALQSLFPTLELGEIPTHRISYEQFEKILIRILMVIDLKACKRKYRSVQSATEKAARDKFLNDACEIINAKGVFAQVVTMKQLKMLGGEPFRRFLSGLIKFTLELELENSSKSLTVVMPDDEQILRSLIKETQQNLSNTLTDLETLESTISKLDSDSRYERLAIEEKWKKMCPNGPKNFDAIKMREIFKTQLEQLDRVNSQARMATSRVLSIPPPPSSGPKRSEEKQKRCSQSLRELCKRLDTNSTDIDGTSQAQTSKQVSRKLEELESGMVELLSDLKKARDRADEQYLRQPRIARLCERFDLLESQFSSIPPLFHHGLDKISEPTEDEINEIIRKYQQVC